ncbi:MAG: Leucyl aminopeptidase yscIV [Sclerophora amabilis]|nr:MAG: Leucyl aminopeptidase yscIV [Sclerophora amabilis]
MRVQQYSGVLAAFVALAQAAPVDDLPLVQSNQLRRVLTRSALLGISNSLQEFAYDTPERNRIFGGPGHNATVNYLYDTIAALGDYYTVEFQPFVQLYFDGTATFSVDGTDQGGGILTYSAAGNVEATLVPVDNLGCDAADYPEAVEGNIAFISRGTCEFGLKSALAGAAGAAAAVIYNNAPGALAGTLGVPPRPEGPYVPTVGISQENATTLLATINSGTTVTGVVSVDAVTENRTTYNVVAQTTGGDQDNVIMVGAHTDSVAEGPGINDNGSGTSGILEVAIQLAKFGVNNAVRFGWWSAEEEGLLGADYYVTNLEQAERDKIRLYLNFDMIASPNFIYGIYDGDGSSFNVSGPPGSAEAEKLFEEYFTKDAGLNFTATDFDGRSDYGPFLDAGIACGGLFTGAEGLKTEEEAKLFGGQAGVAYDVNYHAEGDTVKNLNVGAFIQNTKAIGHAVATYARSFASLPAKAPAKAKRGVSAPTKRRARNQKVQFDI